MPLLDLQAMHAQRRKLQSASRCLSRHVSQLARYSMLRKSQSRLRQFHRRLRLSSTKKQPVHLLRLGASRLTVSLLKLSACQAQALPWASLVMRK